MTGPARVQSLPTSAIQKESQKVFIGQKTPTTGASFLDTLQQAQGIHFSSHAQKRLQSRDIQLSDDNVSRLEQAVDKAEQKGGKSSLVLMDELAFIVNVPDRLVVTAMDVGSREKGVFTQIDTVVFAGKDDDPASKSSINQKA